MAEWQIAPNGMVSLADSGIWLAPNTQDPNYQAFLDWYAAGNTPDHAAPDPRDGMVFASTRALLLARAKAAAAQQNLPLALSLILQLMEPMTP